jgi:hypothetical protein
MGPLWEWIISKLIGRGMNAENSLRLWSFQNEHIQMKPRPDFLSLEVIFFFFVVMRVSLEQQKRHTCTIVNYRGWAWGIYSNPWNKLLILHVMDNFCYQCFQNTCHVQCFWEAQVAVLQDNGNGLWKMILEV